MMSKSCLTRDEETHNDPFMISCPSSAALMSLNVSMFGDDVSTSDSLQPQLAFSYIESYT